MSEYLIFLTYIPKRKLESIEDNFDEYLVNSGHTLSKPYYIME